MIIIKLEDCLLARKMKDIIHHFIAYCCEILKKVHLNDDRLTDLALHCSYIVKVLLHLQHVFKDVDVLLHPHCILEDPW